MTKLETYYVTHVVTMGVKTSAICRGLPLREPPTDHFTAACLVAWPLDESEAVVDSAQPVCFSDVNYVEQKLVSIKSTWFAYKTPVGLYQNHAN